MRDYWPDEPPINLDQLRGLERLHEEFARLLAYDFTFSEGVEQRIDVDIALDDLWRGGDLAFRSDPRLSPELRRAGRRRIGGSGVACGGGIDGRGKKRG